MKCLALYSFKSSIILVIFVSFFLLVGCHVEKNSTDFIDNEIGNVTKGVIPKYKIDSKSINNRIWSARILFKNDELNDTIARRIASKILHEKYSVYDGLMFTILGIEKQDGVPIFLQIYSVKAAKTREAAGALGRWGKSIPFIEFTPKNINKK